MALFNINIFSQYLCGNTEISIIMPERPEKADATEFYTSKKKYKVLWLLHGTFGDHTDWLRKTNIELYACEKDLIVVMPSGMNTNYGNWPTFGMGYNMYDFLFKELMPMVYNWLPASDKREDNFIAGLSMGGRGTCVYAFSRPEKFAAAAVLSATPTNFEKLIAEKHPLWDRMSKSVNNYKDLDDFLAGPENSRRNVTEKAASGELPRVYFACGADDALIYQDFLDFQDYSKEIGLDASFESFPGYKHEWRLWDVAIQHALEFFGL